MRAIRGRCCERGFARVAGWLACLLVLGGCGAKTGLLIPDAGPEAGPDAEVPVDADVEVEADVDVDAEADVEADADEDICLDRPVVVERRRAQVVFVIDRSSSMRWSLTDADPGPGDPSRWDLLADALGRSLAPREELLEIGAKFYPIDGVWSDPDTACDAGLGIDLAPGPGTTDALLSFFTTTYPGVGGTPTARGLAEARDWFLRNPRPELARFVVLATDGGPNCGEAPPIPYDSCICTGTPDYCRDPDFGYLNCLDDARTLSVIESTYEEVGIPVYVIGIDDPGRADLADFLDEMALAGGRPRPEGEERRFWSVRRPGELDDALEEITDVIARCVYVASSPDAIDPRFEVLLDGGIVRRDPDRENGWDWTDPDIGELTFFGAACDRASLPGSIVTGGIPCEG